jgi:hypothetical protein
MLFYEIYNDCKITKNMKKTVIKSQYNKYDNYYLYKQFK